MGRGDRAVLTAVAGQRNERGNLCAFEGLGVGLVLFVWAIGAAVIWAAWALMRRLVQAQVVMSERRFETDSRFDDDGFSPGAGWGRRPMKDVTPPRETQIPPAPRSLPPR